MKRILIMLICSFVLFHAFSQNYFQKTLTQVGFIYNILPFYNSSYAIIGTMNQTYDGFVCKIDSNYNPLQSKLTPGNTVSKIIKLKSGSYYGVGYSTNNSTFLFKIDPNLNINIVKTFNVSSSTYLYDLVQIRENKLVLGGNSGSDWYLLLCDTLGNISWANRYGGWSADDGCQLAANSNGDIFAVGEPESGNEQFSNQNFGIIKVDSLGNYIWGKDFGSTMSEFGWKGIVTKNNNVAMVGYGLDSITGKACAFVGKFDFNGNKLWFKKYLFNNSAHGYDIIENNDSDLVIIGKTYEEPPNSHLSKPLTFCIDKNGNGKWGYSYGIVNGPYDFTRTNAVYLDKYQNIISTGTRPINLNTNTYAGLIIKANKNGLTYCDEISEPYTVSDPYFIWGVFDSLKPVINTTNTVNINVVNNSSFSFNGLCETYTGLKANNNDFTYSIFPNPAKDYLFISIQQNENLIKDFEIIDLYGSVIKKEKFQSCIPISDLKKGIYFIKFNQSADKDKIIKFIKE